MSGAAIHDRSAAITAFRQREVDLGRQGLLDAAGQASAQRTAQNLADGQPVDVTLTFAAPMQNGTVTVKCKNGAEQVIQVGLAGLDDDAIRQAFVHVDNATTRCKTGAAMA